MEIAGLAIGVAGLVGLYGACIDVVERIASYKHYEAESQQLAAKVNADKAILQSWARSVGLTEKGLLPGHDPRLDDAETARAVNEILTCLRDIFYVTDSSALKPDRTLYARRRDKLDWTLRNKRRFAAQVELFGEFVQKLSQLVRAHRPPAFGSLDHGPEKPSLSGDEPPMALLAKVLRRFQDEDREKLIAWLGPVDYEDRYEACRNKRTPDTCSWIFDRRPYVEWSAPSTSNSMAKFLWIHGGAGFGKSVLTAKIVEIIQSDSVLVCYYFFPLASTVQNNPITIIRAWLRQMVHQDPGLCDLAADSIHQAISKGGDLATWNIFAEFVSNTRNAVFLVDGLDQCAMYGHGDQRTENKLRENFLMRLKKTVADSENRVLVVSRAEADIRGQLGAQGPHEAGLRLYEYEVRKADVEADTLAFSQSIVAYQLKSKPPSLKDEIATEMANKCEGMFLWIDLQAQKLRGGKNKLQLLKIIKDMPKDLESIYQRDWETILALSTDDRSRALDILRWTTFGMRPLTVGEITEALVISDLTTGEDISDHLPDSIDEEYIDGEITALCGNLLEVRRTSSDQSLTSMTIHLKHFSVQQFLLSTEAYACLSDTPPEINSAKNTLNNYLAIKCLRYLGCRSVEQSLTDKQSARCFLDYAVGSWHTHISVKGHAYPELIRMALAFFSSKNRAWSLWQSRFEKLNEDIDDIEIYIEKTSPSRAYYAALFGLKEVIEYLRSEDYGIINRLGGIYGTPIKAACIAGHTNIVLQLSQLGAELNIAHGRYGSLLGAASQCGDSVVCENLLEKGVDIHLVDDLGRSPVFLASQYGHDLIVQQLLDRGAEILTVDESGVTPLITASQGGHLKVVRLLLDHGADTSSASGGLTPLAIASSNGHLEVMQLLIDRGADISTKTDKDWSSLTLASYNGHLEVVRLLLDYGADISAATNRGWTPLTLASHRGHLEVVQLLIDHGADMSIATDRGWTPLHHASDEGYLEVVRLLMDRGANISTKTDDGWSSLNLASYNSHLEVVRLLLDYGADISAATSGGWTPLTIALYCGYLEVVQLLIDRGADISIANDRGWTPLHQASDKGYLEVVRLLVDRGADISTKTNNGWSSLILASDNGHIEVVRLLLDRGADISAAENVDWTPLHIAAHKMHVEVVQLLLREGGDPNSLTMMSESPLHVACRQDRSTAIPCLLDSGSDPLAIDGFGRSALDWAVMDPSFDSDRESWAREYIPTPVDKTADALRSSLKQLVSKAFVNIPRHIYEMLGKVLLLLQDDTNALVAYQQLPRYKGSKIYHPTFCNRCASENEIYGRERFVCKVCIDVDLCAQCFETFRSDETPWRCHVHEFLRVDYDEQAIMQTDEEDSKQKVKQWLEKIQKQHLCHSESEPQLDPS